MPTASISTTGRGGSAHTFLTQYEHTTDHNGETWSYSIDSSESPCEFFEARFKAIDFSPSGNADKVTAFARRIQGARPGLTVASHRPVAGGRTSTGRGRIR